MGRLLKGDRTEGRGRERSLLRPRPSQAFNKVIEKLQLLIIMMSISTFGLADPGRSRHGGSSRQRIANIENRPFENGVYRDGTREIDR